MAENKRRMPAGDWYIADDAELAADSVRRAELCRAYNASTGPEERQRVLERLLGSVGDRVRIRRRSSATTAGTSPSAPAPS